MLSYIGRNKEKDRTKGRQMEFYFPAFANPRKVSGNLARHQNMQNRLSSKAKAIFKPTLFCLVFTAIFVVLSFFKNFLPSSAERLSHGIIGTLAAFVATWLFLTFDKKKFSAIELYFDRKTIIRFLVGVLVGVSIMGLLAAGVMYFTNVGIKLNQNSNIWYFLVGTTPLIPLAFMEELGFRAYPLQILKDKTSIRLSIVITSILFALYHIVNGWTIASSFLGPAVWGLIFGIAAIYSKGIAMPTGIHYAANLTTSAFGAKDNPTSIWTITPTDTVTTTFHGMDLTIILPSIAILVLGMLTMEVYLRRKSITNNSLA